MNVDRLDADAIQRALPASAAGRTPEIIIFEEVGSTNAALLERSAPASGQAVVAIADSQTAGRGRRGRRWVSEPGAGLWFSLAYRFENAPPDLATLGLVAGLSARSCVVPFVSGAGLKWPNDIVVGGRKLGGVLVELKTAPGRSLHAVAGIGLNLRTPASLRVIDGLEPVGLDTLISELPGRNTLAALLIEGLLVAFDRFAKDGFAAFEDSWRAADVLAGEAVVLTTGGGRINGIARGIDAQGSLLIDRAGIVTAYQAGDISVRTT